MTTIRRVTPSLVEDFISKMPAFSLGENISCVEFTCAKKENGEDILYCLVRNEKHMGIHLILGLEEIHINGRESFDFLIDWQAYLYYAFGKDFLQEIKQEMIKNIIENSGGMLEGAANMLADMGLSNIKDYSIRKFGEVEDIKVQAR